MNQRLFASILSPLCVLLLLEGYLFPAIGEDEGSKNIRHSILAGTWYPKNEDALIKMVESFLSRATTGSLQGELKAVIVPHAGYVYSGGVAAYVYRLLQKTEVKRVIMIGPSHRVGFRGVSINLQSGYETPLGTVMVDQGLARRLLDASDQTRWLPKAHALEHSLEIQLPFLQRVLKDFQIVPILMGQQDYKTCSHLAKALVRVMDTMDKALLMASTDLSHFHNYSRARELDSEFIKYVRELDAGGLARSLSAGSCEACGGGPTITTMLAAQKLGADRAVILKYANSGDVTGDHSRVVGYLSAALIRASGKDPRR